MTDTLASLRWGGGVASNAQASMEAKEKSDAGNSNSENKEGYVDQPTVAVYDPDQDGSLQPGTLDQEGVLTRHKQWLAEVGFEGMQQMLNGQVLDLLTEVQKIEAQAKAATVYDDYSLFVVGKNTEPHLYESLGELPPNSAVLLTSDRSEYAEGVLPKLEEKFGVDNIHATIEGAKMDVAKKIAGKTAKVTAKLGAKVAVGGIKLAAKGVVGAVKTAAVIGGALVGAG